MPKARERRHYSLIATLLWLLTACAAEQQTGYQLSDGQLDKVQVGKSTREDVLAALGTPSSWHSFGDQRWLYIGNTLKKVSILDPEIQTQQVIAISFDDAGIVKDIEQKNEEDARFVSMNHRVTPTEGHDMSVMEQLIGNFGRFNKQGRGEDMAAGGGAAGGP